VDAAALDIRSDGAAGSLLRVKAAPGGSRDAVVGVLGDALKVATSAPPEGGKANKALAKTLAAALGVSRRSVQINSGHGNPRKVFAVRGMPPAELRKRINAL
jgi:hypothetical protein